MNRTQRILKMATCHQSSDTNKAEELPLTEDGPTLKNNINLDITTDITDEDFNNGFIEVEPIKLTEAESAMISIYSQENNIAIIEEVQSSLMDIDENILNEKIQPKIQTGMHEERNIIGIGEFQTEVMVDREDSDLEWLPDKDENNVEAENENREDGNVTNVEGGNENKVPKKRQRKRNTNKWKRNKLHNLRERGLDYKSISRIKGIKGRELERKKREMGPRCISAYCLKSSKRFCSTINEEIRNQLFSHFWQELSWNDRKSYVASLVDSVAPKQKRRQESGDRRGVTFHYYLKIDNERKEVCRLMFCNTLGIGAWCVQNWAGTAFHGMRSKPSMPRSDAEKSRGVFKTSVQSNDTAPEEQKTKHDASKNSKKRNVAETFIDSLPKLESHYCRRDTSKLYLEPTFQSIMELYRLYQEHCRELKEESLSRFTFCDILNNKNISLFIPRKDQCDLCCQHSTGNLSDEEYMAHIQAKDKAREKKQEDKEKALLKECVVFTVDVQAVKLSPSLKASSLYYKTKLCCHNYTVFNLANNEVDCYWWHEGEGELKASCFTSCLIHKLQQTIDTWPSDISRKEIIIWSDGCGYQNKNKIIANAILQLAIRTGFTIVQKYLQKGHTQMEVDSAHACIEKRLKNRNIYLPEDYITVTKEARRMNPYHAHCLDYTFFKDYTIAEAEIYASIRPGKKVSDPTINLISKLQYTPDGIIQYALDFDSPLENIPQRPCFKKELVIYPNLYKSKLKIKQAKWEHLQQLKSVIPAYAHNFYDNLLH